MRGPYQRAQVRSTILADVALRRVAVGGGAGGRTRARGQQLGFGVERVLRVLSLDSFVMFDNGGNGICGPISPVRTQQLQVGMLASVPVRQVAAGSRPSLTFYRALQLTAVDLV